MADKVIPVDVRNVIVTWPDDGPRGAVARFCAEHGVSRSQFYAIRARAKDEGPVAAMLPKGRSVPVRHRLAVPLPVEELAVRIRKELTDDGWDAGPVTVRHKLLDLGIAAPAASTLARIFTRRGMVVPQPQKRPKTSWRRFEAGCVHECWQLDGFGWALADGTAFTILQVTDDKSRFPIATRAAAGERSVDAIAVIRAGIERFQVPCRVLTDNGAAFNSDRLGRRTPLVAFLTSLGARAVTGRPGHPQTQGKNERAHLSLQKWLRARPAPATLDDAQQLLNDYDSAFAVRRHQSLGMRTPVRALRDGPVAIPPLPPAPVAAAAPAARTLVRRVATNGNVTIATVKVQLGRENAATAITAVITGTVISIFSTRGILIRTVHLEPGTRYYGNGRPRGGPRRQ